MTPAQILEELQEANPEALTCDGFDEALIGLGRRCGQPTLAVYDFDKALNLLVQRDELSPAQAQEHLEFNVVGAWMGEHTPLWLIQ